MTKTDQQAAERFYPGRNCHFALRKKQTPIMMWGSDTQEESIEASKAIACPSIEIPSEVVHSIFLAGAAHVRAELEPEIDALKARVKYLSENMFIIDLNNVKIKEQQS